MGEPNNVGTERNVEFGLLSYGNSAQNFTWNNIRSDMRIGFICERVNNRSIDARLRKLLNIDSAANLIEDLKNIVCNPVPGEKISKSLLKKVVDMAENISEMVNIGNNNKIGLINIYECLQQVVGIGRVKPNEKVVLQVKEVHRNRSILFNDSLLAEDNMTDVYISCYIPKSSVNKVLIEIRGKEGTSKKVLSSFVFHRQNTIYPTSNRRIGQFPVFSIKIGNSSITELQEPIRYNLSVPARQSALHSRLIRCGYYNIAERDWKFDGCRFENEVGNECSCNHTTNFAVIMQIFPLTNDEFLNVFSKAACAISAISLALLLLLYILTKNLRKNKVNQLLIQLCLCLEIFYVVFLFGINRTECPTCCTAVAVILQFSLLSSWGWMTVECIGLYRKCVLVFSGISSAFIRRSALVVYLLSAITTALTSIIAEVTLHNELKNWRSPAVDGNKTDVGYLSYYRSTNLCWLTGNSLYFGFLTPVLLMMLFNTIASINIITKITKKVEIRSTSREDRGDLIVVLVVCTLLGVPWITAIPTLLTGDRTVNAIFSWIFSIATALQGFIIFLLYCVRPEKVRKIWWKPEMVTRLFRRHDTVQPTTNYDTVVTVTGKSVKDR